MKTLGSLIDGLDTTAAATPITGVAINHRQITPGSLFGAFRGAQFNAEDVIPEAVAAGAVAVIASSGAKVEGALHIASDNPRKVFADAATRFFACAPATLAAVTGTNGKTSTVELMRQLWRMDGHVSASIGTLGITTGNEQVKTGLTTPDIVTFLSNLAGLAREGVTHLAYEASSHGLDQYRSEGPRVAVGIFTNLSRDHLDYHGDMEHYFAAKMRLFDEVVAGDGSAVIWADDAWSERAAAHARQRGLNIVTVGENGRDITLLDRVPTSLGQTLRLAIAGLGEREIHLPLIGGYQAANALVSAAAVQASGDAAGDVFAHLERVQPVRGRLERAALTRKGAPIYVDYAHTPDALTAALAALRPHVAKRLIVVFGAGGDRDTGKRPQMGAEAVRGAEYVIVTDDNPRGEDPALIRRAVLAGAPGAIEIGDRRQAIAAAIAEAGAGDIVLVAGKGHEQGQIVGRGTEERILPFDDVEVAREEAGQ